MKTVIIILVTLAVLVGGWFLIADRNLPAATPTPSASATPTPSVSVSATPTPSSTPTPTSNPDIRVTAPVKNAKITNPLTITGEARGSWYFEAVFPIKLYDANGKLIAQTQGQAQSDWMTVNFVPFKATLIFTKPATATGTLVLENDNPSGLPQNAKAIAIPVRF